MVTEGTAPTDGTATSRVLPPGPQVGVPDDLPAGEVPGAGRGPAVSSREDGRVGRPRASADGEDPVRPGHGAADDRVAVTEDRPRNHLADHAAVLFGRWRAGEVDASRELVGLLTPTLWHTARAYRLDAAVAEDVVQNAWLALARRRDQVRDPQAVLGWLLVTVRRDAARTASAARAGVGDPEPVLAASPDPAPGPAATVIDEDRARRLWAAVGRLSERCQRLLRVVAFSERPDYASLSHDLGMPVGSIGPTRGRCLKKLREHLGQEQEWTT